MDPLIVVVGVSYSSYGHKMSTYILKNIKFGSTKVKPNVLLKVVNIHPVYSAQVCISQGGAPFDSLLYSEYSSKATLRMIAKPTEIRW